MIKLSRTFYIVSGIVIAVGVVVWCWVSATVSEPPQPQESPTVNVWMPPRDESPRAVISISEVTKRPLLPNAGIVTATTKTREGFNHFDFINWGVSIDMSAPFTEGKLQYPDQSLAFRSSKSPLTITIACCAIESAAFTTLQKKGTEIVTIGEKQFKIIEGYDGGGSLVHVVKMAAPKGELIVMVSINLQQKTALAREELIALIPRITFSGN